MKYSAKKLAKTLYEISHQDNTKELDNFFNFCDQKNLNYLLPNILKYYREILAKKSSQNTVLIKSTHQLDKKTLDAIKKKINATKDTKVEQKIDPETLGGFIAEYRNKVFDASLKNQLAKLKNKLINS